MNANPTLGVADDDVDETTFVARGVATAVAPDTGLTDAQTDLLEAITHAVAGVSIDFRALAPVGPQEFAEVLRSRRLDDRQRIVHQMVLGELMLRPIPVVVAHRVAMYAEALGVNDDFVRVARRYAQGAFGLAWLDLQHKGFLDHVREASGQRPSHPFDPAQVDPDLAARWTAFADLPVGTLGRGVWELYIGRGFGIPGTEGGAPVYLAQHDFVHVLADYGTNLKGELEVFGLISRADPDPKGFAWLATLIGLFETGYISSAGFFDRDVRERHVRAPGMQLRLADAIRRGKVVCDCYGADLFEVDYHALADRPVEEVRTLLRMPPKSSGAIEEGSVGAFDLEGMSEAQRRIAAQRHGDAT